MTGAPATVGDACPCGSGRALAACCGPILDGTAPAVTAEALMRSRYAAFVLGDVEHLVQTHDASTRSKEERAAFELWSRESQWLGLEVLAVEAGGAGDEQGVVEFRARYRRAGVERTHHERSRFRRRDGAWRYLDGETPRPRPATRAATVGRNDACPCGSGKKWKRCCGAA